MTTNNPNDLDDVDFTDEDLLDQDLSDDLGDDLNDDLGDEYDDGESYDENWEDQPAKTKPVKAKKKTSVFTIVLIVVGVLIAGVVILALVGGSKSQAPAPETEITAPSPDLTPSAADPNNLAGLQNGAAVPSDQTTTGTAPSSQGFMNDPTVLDQSAQDSGQAPSLPETPSMTGFADTAPAPAMEAPANLPVPGENINTNLPNIDLIKKAAPTPVTAEAPAVVPAPVANVAPAAIAIAPAAIDQALQGKLDQVISRIDSLEKKIAETPAANNSVANSGELARLSIAVERLENKVSQLSNAPVVKQASVPSYSDNNDSTVVVKKSVPKKKKAAPKEAASTKWELRSARPGEAMVGKAGQADLKVIRIGDSIAGIGQIESISQSGGRWVVQGTSGRITQ